MKPYILIHCTDLPRSAAWYRALGFMPRRQGRQGTWAELHWDGLLLFLHQSGQRYPDGFAMPGFEVQQSLEGVLERLASVTGGETVSILDEAFGRVAFLRDPDGYEWQLIEHEPELYA